jgi:CRISPR system Cascade subunit CasD
MSTLLLRLAAPLQSWGVASKFDTRDTTREPTKSGVIGLLAAALGRRRTEGLEDLKALRFGVRVDQPGTLLRDFHIAQFNEKAPPFVTTRFYLADAVFLVGLEGEDNFLQELIVALKNPVFPLYLGRRSCPPVGGLVLGLREWDLRQALEEEPWQASEWFQNECFRKRNMEQVKLTIVYDAQPGEQGAFLRRDLPVSFDQRHRRYNFRMVRDIAEAIVIRAPQRLTELSTDHDAMAGWGD